MARHREEKSEVMQWQCGLFAIEIWNTFCGDAVSKFECFYSPCDRPRIIESLRGKEVVDISAGGAHSACITGNGELYTWGKGRYGRLGHGDSEDQTRPKLVCHRGIINFVASLFTMDK